MKQRTAALLALFNIFLLMSIDPINAVRVAEVEGLAQDISELEVTLRDLERALREQEAFANRHGHAQGGAADAGEDARFWLFGSCSDKERDFDASTAKLKAGISKAQAEGDESMLTGAGLLLKTHEAMKALATAQEKGCEWAQGEKLEARKAALDAIVAESGVEVPCKAQAQAAMSGPGTQQQRVTKALEILLSESDGCEAVRVQAAPPKAVAPDGERGEAEFEEEAENKEAELAEALLTTTTTLASSELQTESSESTTTTTTTLASSELQTESSESTESTDSLLQRIYISRRRRSGSGFSSDRRRSSYGSSGGYGSSARDRNELADLIGFLILIVVVVVLGAVFLAKLVVGLIMCSLKSILAAVVNIFKKSENKWEVDWKGCMAWFIRSEDDKDTR